MELYHEPKTQSIRRTRITITPSDLFMWHPFILRYFRIFKTDILLLQLQYIIQIHKKI